MSEFEIARFASDAAAFHALLVQYFIALKPTHPHYRALQRLHESLLVAVMDVTGREADWCVVGPGRMPAAR